jgi:hypothetical protein
MAILSYHCPVLTIQREFVKLFPPGHQRFESLHPVSLILAEDLTNFPELGMCSKDSTSQKVVRTETGANQNRE